MKYVVGFQDCNRSNIPYMDSMGCKIPILNNILNVSEKPDPGLLKILCDVKDLVVPCCSYQPFGASGLDFLRIPGTGRDWDSKGYI